MPNQSLCTKLAIEIRNYILYLNKKFGYRITLHQIESVSYENWPQLLSFNYHDCSVCREIKSSAKGWMHCIDRQNKVQKKADQGPFVGTCYAGVTEVVFPLRDIHDKCVGFLCVSGYTADRKMSGERARAAARRYGLAPEAIYTAVEQLNDQLPGLEELASQLAPMLALLTMLFYLNSIYQPVRESVSAREKLYYDILQYANSNFRNPDFGLKNVCKHFNISYTYASHLFAQYNEQSFARYVRRMRIETAKRYMEHTTLSIVFSAYECGFSDSNYFSSVFKAETGLTPSEYRSRYRQTCEKMTTSMEYHLKGQKENDAQNDH